jgi:hypothetical protein
VLRITSPIVLLSTTTDCWRCHERVDVWALMVSSLVDEENDVAFHREPIILKHISHHPTVLAERVRALGFRAEVKQSKLHGTAYLANACACGAMIGDEGLHRSPGEGFFPTTPSEAASIMQRQLEVQAPFHCRADYIQGPGDLIQQHAPRC